MVTVDYWSLSIGSFPVRDCQAEIHLCVCFKAVWKKLKLQKVLQARTVDFSIVFNVQPNIVEQYDTVRSTNFLLAEFT